MARVFALILVLVAVGLPAVRLWTAVVSNPTTGDTDTSAFYVLKHQPSWQSHIELDEKSEGVIEVGTPVVISEFGLPLEETYLRVMSLVPLISPLFVVVAILLYRSASFRKKQAARTS
jgi:hypothetical protein